MIKSFFSPTVRRSNLLSFCGGGQADVCLLDSTCDNLLLLGVKSPPHRPRWSGDDEVVCEALPVALLSRDLHDRFSFPGIWVMSRVRAR